MDVFHRTWMLNKPYVLFWSFVLLSFALMVLSAPCSESKGQSWIAVTFLTALVFISFWEAHVHTIRHGADQKPRLIWQITRRAVSALLLIFVAISLGSTVSLMFHPAYQCYTDKAQVSEMLRLLGQQREEITERIQTSKTVANSGAGMSIKKQGRIVGGVVTESGTMIAISQDPPAMVMLAPEFIKPASAAEKGEVKWTCSGCPEKSMPMSCRPPIAPP